MRVTPLGFCLMVFVNEKHTNIKKTASSVLSVLLLIYGLNTSSVLSVLLFIHGLNTSSVLSVLLLIYGLNTSSVPSVLILIYGLNTYLSVDQTLNIEEILRKN